MTSAASIPSSTRSSTRRPGTPRWRSARIERAARRRLAGRGRRTARAWTMAPGCRCASSIRKPTCPVFQVSLPAGLTPAQAYALGQALRPLRDEGVMVVGSGSLTHNLYEFRMDDGGPQAEYAREFAAWVRQTVEARDDARLLTTLEAAPHARRAHPTAEHFLPLLVAAGAAAGGRRGRDAAKAASPMACCPWTPTCSVPSAGPRHERRHRHPVPAAGQRALPAVPRRRRHAAGPGAPGHAACAASSRRRPW